MIKLGDKAWALEWWEKSIKLCISVENGIRTVHRACRSVKFCPTWTYSICIPIFSTVYCLTPSRFLVLNSSTIGHKEHVRRSGRQLAEQGRLHGLPTHYRWFFRFSKLAQMTLQLHRLAHTGTHSSSASQAHVHIVLAYGCGRVDYAWSRATMTGRWPSTAHNRTGVQNRGHRDSCTQ